MGYRVILTPAAQRQLERSRGATLSALRGVILGLADQSVPPGAAKLAGQRDLWRIRLRIDGRPWRVVYQLRSDAREVVVTRVVPRDEGTYRDV
jgi:mRNA-degrading endonuclease RelE of RelBE toxin-antitoxin system